MAAVVGNLLKSFGNLSISITSASKAASGFSHNYILKNQAATQACIPLVTAVRYRYHADKVAKGPVLKNFGYEDKLHNKGLMPHLDPKYRNRERLPIRLYRPKNAWAEKRALKGQNDYIDILGDGSLHPTEVLYSVPFWLRGFKGNEFQMLLRKKKYFGRSMRMYQPTKYRNMNLRIKYLYRFLNRKTKDYYWSKA